MTKQKRMRNHSEICSINDCDGLYRSKGYCNKHYFIFHKYGDALANTREIHGYRYTTMYNSYMNMKSRCFNENSPRYKDYGGRGITVCDRWKSKFTNFLEDMGEPPSSKHSIDRKDVNGNYEPGNCRWATTEEQSLNRRNSKLITINGVTKNQITWAKELKMSSGKLKTRLELGWDIKRITQT